MGRSEFVRRKWASSRGAGFGRGFVRRADPRRSSIFSRRLQNVCDNYSRVPRDGTFSFGFRSYYELDPRNRVHTCFGRCHGDGLRSCRKWHLARREAAGCRYRVGSKASHQPFLSKEIEAALLLCPCDTSVWGRRRVSHYRVWLLASRSFQGRLRGSNQDGHDGKVLGGVEGPRRARGRRSNESHSGAFGGASTTASQHPEKGECWISYRKLSDWPATSRHIEEASRGARFSEAREDHLGSELRERSVIAGEKEKITEGARSGQALYAAVEQRQLLDRKAGADGRPSSSSKKKKKKKKKEKRKKKKDSSSGSSSTSDGSSSDDLKPPLQRKAERKPGSVLKMLMDHVRLSLSDLSLGHSGEGGAASSVTSTARVQSYFQILVRPQLHNRPRDEKELFSLALGLDLLRQGKMEQVADLLAGRYIAVETAALEGSWDTAKWLEVSRLEDRGVANPEVLLAARKHQRTIDRASGRGSYGRGGEHYWDSGGYDASLWSSGGAGRGRGRGGRKGKDGKGKGKKGKAGKKGVNQVWWDDAPPKDGEKESGKKGDQAK